MRYAASRTPRQTDLCTISPPAQHKRAALLFDRIFVPAGDFDYIDTPEPITFGEFFETSHPDWDLWLRYGLNVYAVVDDRGRALPPLTPGRHKMLGFDRYLANRYAAQGVTVVSGYRSEASFRAAFADSGASLAYHAALANLPVLDDTTAWDEILAFRDDPDSFSKSRRLRRWLFEGVRASSPGHAADIVSGMVDDYRATLRKHGMKTLAGGLTLFAAAFGAGVAAASAGVIGALAAGLAVSAGTVAWLIKHETDLDDIERGKNSEIAIIYEALERFDQNTPPGTE